MPGLTRLRSDRADFLGLGALLPPPGGVGNPLVLLQAAEAVSLDGRVMDEHVGGSVVGGDKAVALVGVEPLDGAFSHVLLLHRRSFRRHVRALRVIATASLPGRPGRVLTASAVRSSQAQVHVTNFDYNHYLLNTMPGTQPT